MWRASQLLHICLVDKPVIPLYISLYPVTLICIHICVQKYTSVYLLRSTNSFAFVFRFFYNIPIEGFFKAYLLPQSTSFCRYLCHPLAEEKPASQPPP